MVIETKKTEPTTSKEDKEGNEKKLFFSILSKKFHIDGKKLTKDFSNIQKLAWEQVLLLCIDSRQRGYNASLYSEHKSFQSKMDLIALTEDLCYKIDEGEVPNFEILEFVVKFLDSNKGIVELTKQLLLKSENEAESDKIKLLLNEIERRRISFSALKELPPTPPISYSHYEMYISLNRPIRLFNPLLNIPQLSNTMVFIEEFINIFKQYIRIKYGGFRNISDHEKYSNLISDLEKVQDASSLKEFLNKQLEIIDLDNFREEFESKLMERISKIVTESFKELEIRGEDSFKSGRNKVVFEELCNVKTDSESNIVNITIKKEVLSGFVHLGQLDTLISELSTKLKNNVLGSSDHHRIRQGLQPDGYNTSLGMLGSWYQHCQTKLFRKFEDIPRLIASILVFDIRNRIGQFNESNCFLPTKLNNNDLALITTNIIKNCLYKSAPLELFNCIAFGNSNYIPSVNKNNDIEIQLQEASQRLQDQGWAIINDNDSSNFQSYQNLFMDTWANTTEISKTLERMKKLIDFKKVGKKTYRAYDLILSQQKIGHAYAYPIHTHFPLPLWVKFKEE